MKTYYIYKDNQRLGPFEGTEKLKKMRLSLDTLIYDNHSKEWEELRNHVDKKRIVYNFPNNFLLLKKETKDNFKKTIGDDFSIFCLLPLFSLTLFSFSMSPSVSDISNKGMEFLYASHQNYILRPLYFGNIYIYSSEYNNPTLLFFNLFISSSILIGIPFISIKSYLFYKLQKDDREFYKKKILQWIETSNKKVIMETLKIDYSGTSFEFKEILDNTVEKNICYVAFETTGNLTVTTTK